MKKLMMTMTAVALAGALGAATTEDNWYPCAEMANHWKGEPERRLVWTLESGIDDRGDWEATAKFLKENGYTDVIVRLARGGVAFYESKVVPVSPLVKEQGDLLKKAVSACHRYGIKVHAWKVFWRLNMAPQDYVARAIADGRVMYGRSMTPFCSVWQNPSGEVVKGEKNDYWLCPQDRRNQDEEIAVMKEMALLGVDGLHFDYIRYNAWYGCYCPNCRKRYEAKVGHECPDWPKCVDPMVRLDSLWLGMRADAITTTVKRTMEEVRKVRPDIEFSAAVFPEADEHVYHAQPWRTWCREGLLDFVCPMTYCRDREELRMQIVPMIHTANESPKTRIYPSVGVVFGKDKAAKSAEEVRDHASIIRWAGFPGVSYYKLDPKSRASLESPRPTLSK